MTVGVKLYMTEPRLSPNSSALTFFIALLISCCLLSSARAEPPKRFSVPAPNKTWSFPRDHGAHSEFQTEWWYFTGQLVLLDRVVLNKDTAIQFTSEAATSEGATSERSRADEIADVFKNPADFGFQLTFFRRALFDEPVDNPKSEALIAHAAITDVKDRQFVFEKRYQRQGLSAGNSNLSQSTLAVNLGGWQAVLNPKDEKEVELAYSVKGFDVKLVARMSVPIMYQGDNGFSRKGNCATCSSQYYSLPRLELTGTVTKNGKSMAVHGLGWMDHEFMSDALQPDQEGWDWISLMTKDGSSIMYFRLRGKTETAEYSACSIMNSLGDTKACRAIIEIQNYWKSSFSGARYPSELRMLVDGKRYSLKTVVANQELSDRSVAAEADSNEATLNQAMSYYEGALSASDSSAVGYIELTGYDKPLSQRF